MNPFVEGIIDRSEIQSALIANTLCDYYFSSDPNAEAKWYVNHEILKILSKMMEKSIFFAESEGHSFASTLLSLLNVDLPVLLSDDEFILNWLINQFISSGEKISNITKKISTGIGDPNALIPLSEEIPSLTIQTSTKQTQLRYFQLENGSIFETKEEDSEKEEELSVDISGLEKLKLSSGATKHIKQAKAVVLISSDLVSLVCLFKTPAVKEALKSAEGQVIVIIPHFDEETLPKGEKIILELMGLEPNMLSVAQEISESCDSIIIDTKNKECVNNLRDLGLIVLMEDLSNEKMGSKDFETTVLRAGSLAFEDLMKKTPTNIEQETSTFSKFIKKLVPGLRSDEQETTPIGIESLLKTPLGSVEPVITIDQTSQEDETLSKLEETDETETEEIDTKPEENISEVYEGATAKIEEKGFTELEEKEDLMAISNKEESSSVIAKALSSVKDETQKPPEQEAQEESLQIREEGVQIVDNSALNELSDAIALIEQNFDNDFAVLDKLDKNWKLTAESSGTEDTLEDQFQKPKAENIDHIDTLIKKIMDSSGESLTNIISSLDVITSNNKEIVPYIAGKLFQALFAEQAITNQIKYAQVIKDLYPSASTEFFSVYSDMLIEVTEGRILPAKREAIISGVRLIREAPDLLFELLTSLIDYYLQEESDAKVERAKKLILCLSLQYRDISSRIIERLLDNFTEKSTDEQAKIINILTSYEAGLVGIIIMETYSITNAKKLVEQIIEIGYFAHWSELLKKVAEAWISQDTNKLSQLSGSTLSDRAEIKLKRETIAQMIEKVGLVPLDVFAKSIKVDPSEFEDMLYQMILNDELHARMELRGERLFIIPSNNITHNGSEE
ncbi:MAG: PCI domain-containing protein [Candidatus Kariarchaeaceae archaeon]